MTNLRQTRTRPALHHSFLLTLSAALALPVFTFAQAPAVTEMSAVSSAEPASKIAPADSLPETLPDPLPDAPQPKLAEASAPAVGSASTARNRSKFRNAVRDEHFVVPDIAETPSPLSTGEKFQLFVKQSVSPPYLLVAGISASYSQARNVPSAYGQGWDAYGDRFGAAMARAASGSFFSTFVFASAFHQDPRFYPQRHPTVWGSIKYSAKRLVMTRNDEGNAVVNTSGLLGTLAAEGLANAYLPVSQQSFGKTAQRYGTDTAWRFAGNMFRNYWPTIFQKFQLKRLAIIPQPQATDTSTPGSPE